MDDTNGQSKQQPRFSRMVPRTQDTRGVVVVMVRRLDKGRALKGNKTRTIQVPATTVSEISALIEAALFGDTEQSATG